VKAPVGNGVPAKAGAVVPNRTATASTDAGYLAAFPAGEAIPNASNWPPSPRN